MATGPITLVAGGSLGDVQPLIAIGRGLRAAGYDVRLAGQRAFATLAASSKFEFTDLQSSDPAETKEREIRRKPGVIRTLASMLVREGPEPTLLRVLERACVGSSAIIFTAISGLAFHVAEALGIPSFLASLHPIYPTGEFATPFMPAKLSRLELPSALNWASHWSLQQLFWQVDRPWLNRWRRSMGLRPAGRVSSFELMRRKGTHFLFGFSPRVVTKPADWPEDFEVTGYWLEEPATFDPPPDLADFISGGERPTFIGFGSTFDRTPAELGEAVARAIAMAGTRVVVGRGLQGVEVVQNTNVFVADYVPFSWLYPRMRAVVHHAGAGTCAEAVRCGVPSICIPFFAEQRFWARRLAKRGVSSAPIFRDELTAEALASAIRAVHQDDAMAERARRLANAVAYERGVERVVNLIRKSLNGR